MAAHATQSLPLNLCRTHRVISVLPPSDRLEPLFEAKSSLRRMDLGRVHGQALGQSRFSKPFSEEALQAVTYVNQLLVFRLAHASAISI